MPSARANSSASTAIATSSTAASTNEKTWKADRSWLSSGSLCADDDRVLLVPGQEHRDEQRRARRRPRAGCSGVSARQRAAQARGRSAGPLAHARAAAAAALRRASRTSASCSETARICPWNASFQCSRGHLPMCSRLVLDDVSARDPLVLRQHQLRLGSRSATGTGRPCRACPARSSRGPRTARRSRGSTPRTP